MKGLSNNGSPGWVSLSRAVIGVMIISASLLVGCAKQNNPLTVAEGLVTLTISTNRLLVGDILRAELSIEHPANTSIEFSAPASEDEFTLLNRDWDSEESPESKQITRASYELQSFALGDIVLFQNPLILKKGEETESLPVPEMVIRRESSLDLGETTLQDYKAPILWPKSPNYRIFWVLFLILLLSGIIALIVLLWIRHSRKPPPAEPVIPPHERAMAALRDLQAKDFIQQGAFESYYVELSSIVRSYLEDRFKLRAPEQTTEEFIRSMTGSPTLNATQQERVKAFMIQSDLVKFAKFQPATKDAENAMNSATELVEETKETPHEVNAS